MYTIIVDWTVHPDQADRFFERVLKQAEDSLALEPECHVFDVLRDPEDPAHFLLYEKYGAASDFQVHLDSAHFADFSGFADPVTVTKTVSVWDCHETG